MFSAMAYIFGQWAPENEKSRLIGFAQAGMDFGSVVALVLGGVLCESGFYEGWGSLFIIFGASGIVWMFLLLFLVSDSPTNHRFISQVERNYILKHIPETNTKKRLKTPWKEIFTSKPCLAVFFTNFCSNWGFFLFLSMTPIYLKDILKFDIKAV